MQEGDLVTIRRTSAVGKIIKIERIEWKNPANQGSTIIHHAQVEIVDPGNSLWKEGEVAHGIPLRDLELVHADVCSHDFVAKALLHSVYLRCKHCGKEITEVSPKDINYSQLEV